MSDKIYMTLLEKIGMLASESRLVTQTDVAGRYAHASAPPSVFSNRNMVLSLQ